MSNAMDYASRWLEKHSRRVHLWRKIEHAINIDMEHRGESQRFSIDQHGHLLFDDGKPTQYKLPSWDVIPKLPGIKSAKEAEQFIMQEMINNARIALAHKKDKRQENVDGD